MAPWKPLVLFWPDALLTAMVAKAFVEQSPWAYTSLLSGAAPLSYILISGKVNGSDKRLLSSVPICFLILSVNLTEMVSATSWLFIAIFTSMCWPLVFLAGLYRWQIAAEGARLFLRKVFDFAHFSSDYVALFNLPAIDIDPNMADPVIVKGVKFSFSTMTLTVYGIEVSVKLSGNVELSLRSEKVNFVLLRGIEVDSICINVKTVLMDEISLDSESKTCASENTNLMNGNISHLKSASKMGKDAKGDVNIGIDRTNDHTADTPLNNNFLRNMWLELRARRAISHVVDNNTGSDGREVARSQKTGVDMEKLNATRKADARIRRLARLMNDKELNGNNDLENDELLRASICSHLQTNSPMQNFLKSLMSLTTLQQLAPSWILRFLRRSPLLIRLFLNLFANFHPIRAEAITLCASGWFMKRILESEMFSEYANENVHVGKLRNRILEGSIGVDFLMGMKQFTGQAVVPISTENDITCRMKVDDITLYRAEQYYDCPRKLCQLGGAESTITLPSMLLLHHDHLLRSTIVGSSSSNICGQELREMNSYGAALQARWQIKQNTRDETYCRISVRIRFPADFSEEVHKFLPVLVKASKFMVELDRECRKAAKENVRNIKDVAKLIKCKLRRWVRQTAVNDTSSDRWIAELVKRIMTHLESSQGNVGYAGTMPVSLKPYREAVILGETKLLP